MSVRIRLTLRFYRQNQYSIYDVRGSQERLTRYTLYSIINPKERNRGLKGRLETPHLADCRLQNTSRDVVADVTGQQVKAVAQECLLGVPGRSILRNVMVCAELGHELRRVLGRIHSECLRDDQQRACELGDGQLFPRTLRDMSLFASDVCSGVGLILTSVVAKFSR